MWQFDAQGQGLPACLQTQGCRRLAVYDIPNGITNVIDDADADGLTELVASGTDAGVAHAISIGGLTNYKSYYYGVRAYGYNDLAAPPVLYSPMVTFEAIPTKTHNNLSPEAVAAAAGSAEPDLVGDLDGIGDGSVSADVVNPAAIRAGTYSVVFYELPEGPNTRAEIPAEDPTLVDALPVRQDASKSAAGGITYDIMFGSEKVFDGAATGEPLPQLPKIAVIDGLEFSVEGPQPGFKNFLMVSNAAGPLDPPDIGNFAFNSNGYPTWLGSDRPDASRQQTNGSTWGIAQGGGGDALFTTFNARVLRGDNITYFGIYDYEMRYTTAGGKAYRRFEDGAIVDVPFELWRTGIATPDDPSDDMRMIPAICESACGGGTVDLVYDIGNDHPVSGGANDPFTDWIYWYTPVDESAGSAGYDSFFADGSTDDVNHEVLARTVMVNWNGGVDPGPYDADLPETGSTLRIVSKKPNQPGDVYSFSTEGLQPTEATDAEKVARLEDIGVVPNPYLGASSYERSQLTDQVRFTDLPDVATLRVFSLNGSLLRTLEKNSVGQESLVWDVTTDEGLPMASGMYLIHVEVPGVGSKVIKFGYVKKVTRLNTF
ncbi:MAG: T9SS type A sorting domain-containing protein [Rhodothermales bacterium]|nr:T9SS type A sorting domain-containing protein [Rhodothermales bacterium]